MRMEGPKNIPSNVESEQLQNLREGLKSMEGPEMRKILDKEFELNSAQSPIDATDPNRRDEYDEWVRAIHDSRRATQELKEALKDRIEDRKTEIYELEKEQGKI